MRIAARHHSPSPTSISANNQSPLLCTPPFRLSPAPEIPDDRLLPPTGSVKTSLPCCRRRLRPESQQLREPCPDGLRHRDSAHSLRSGGQAVNGLGRDSMLLAKASETAFLPPTHNTAAIAHSPQQRAHGGTRAANTEWPPSCEYLGRRMAIF